MVHFQTRIDLTSNMKQFTTYSNMLQVGQLRASEKESSIYENLLLADMQSQPKWYIFRHGLISH